VTKAKIVISANNQIDGLLDMAVHEVKLQQTGKKPGFFAHVLQVVGISGVRVCLVLYHFHQIVVKSPLSVIECLSKRLFLSLLFTFLLLFSYRSFYGYR
jgi:hypothetical protein